MGKKLNEINPELKKDDRIVVIYMQGESSESTGGIEFGETKGKVIGKINQPKSVKILSVQMNCPRAFHAGI